jgi:hypothetical protein
LGHPLEHLAGRDILYQLSEETSEDVRDGMPVRCLEDEGRLHHCESWVCGCLSRANEARSTLRLGTTLNKTYDHVVMPLGRGAPVLDPRCGEQKEKKVDLTRSLSRQVDRKHVLAERFTLDQRSTTCPFLLIYARRRGHHSATPDRIARRHLPSICSITLAHNLPEEDTETHSAQTSLHTSERF